METSNKQSDQPLISTPVQVYSYHRSMGDGDWDEVLIMWDGKTTTPCLGATTRFSCDGIKPKPKATDEQKEQARLALFDEVKDTMSEGRAWSALKNLSKGDEVEVYKGRKGTGVGKVIWLQESHNYTKVGVATSDQKDDKGFHSDVIWTYKTNLRVKLPEVLVDDFSISDWYKDSRY